MSEVFTFLAGTLLGVVVRGAPVAQRRLLLTVLGPLFGLLASLLSGELRMSLSFWLLDSLFVIAVAWAVGRVFPVSLLRD